MGNEADDDYFDVDEARAAFAKANAAVERAKEKYQRVARKRILNLVAGTGRSPSVTVWQRVELDDDVPLTNATLRFDGTRWVVLSEAETKSFAGEQYAIVDDTPLRVERGDAVDAIAMARRTAPMPSSDSRAQYERRAKERSTYAGLSASAPKTSVDEKRMSDAS